MALDRKTLMELADKKREKTLVQRLKTVAKNVLRKVHAPKNVNGYDIKYIQKRVQLGYQIVEYIAKNVDDYDVCFGNGNKKLNGTAEVNFVVALSLFPIMTCKNCSGCKNKCYDICHDMIMTGVFLNRCINTAIYFYRRERFWQSLDNLLEGDCVPCVRLNEGGDLEYKDFFYIRNIAKKHKVTKILFFTKNYDDMNRWLDEGNRFPNNVCALMSGWDDMEMDNKHNLPETHVIWMDGCHSTNRKDGYICTGNCSWCYLHHKGCWYAKNGEIIFFYAH